MSLNIAEIKKTIKITLGLSHLKENQQEEIASLVLDNIFSKINLEIWKKLSDKEKKEAKSILSKSKNKKALDYFQDKVKDFYGIAESAASWVISDFKKRRLKI